ncbi:putative cytochrome P450 [Lasiosphaeria ovina]|uniref:Cytochrome P450 n=1 Tax=Lasiosphaeria ovina TaxID=92902 RepID=A0AAE0NJA0_9PEZI|nr:putative cytochrome P450 [Lasiosphaeria ovina]
MLGLDLVGVVFNGQLLLGFTLGLILWQAATAAHNLFLHPLRRFPGPMAQRASSLPWTVLHLRKTQMFATQKLHKRYGPVVCIAPGHLSFTDVRVYKDIYAPETPEAAAFYDPIDDIANAGREEHQRVRRAVSQGFSEAALRQYGPVIDRYVDKLLRQLHERSGAPLDCAACYTWATFNIAAELVFGKPIGCLDACAYHPWVKFIMAGAKSNAVLSSLCYVGHRWVVQLLFRTFGRLTMTRHKAFTDSMKRSARDADLDCQVQADREQNMSFDKLSANAFVFMLAGSGTSAAALSGITYLLLTNPEALARLREEVRSTFSSAAETKIGPVSKLPYLSAVLSEGLLVYPPQPTDLVRVVPAGGGVIAGHSVAGGAYVEVQPWSISHSREHWADPDAFRHERFLAIDDEARRAGNRFEALQPFSFGPRSCIGRPSDWIRRQGGYPLWDRPPLKVRFTTRA